MATTVEDAVDSTVQLDANVDINLIDDEDLLRKLWQCNEDFSEKRRIRARMYKLREKRLKDFYTNDDVLGVGEGSTSRSASPFTMMEAQTAPENGNVSMASSSTVTSYSYTTSSTSTGGDMEVDQPEGAASRRLSRRQMAEQNKRRGSDELDDAISEKIRRKSSERTKRYQKILSEISSSESATADGEASQPAPAPADDETVRRAEDLGFSTQNTMEGSASVDDVDSPRKINSRSVTSRQSTVETTTTRSERRSSAGGPKVVQQSTVQSQVDEASRQGSLTTSSPSMKTIEHSFSSSSSSRSTGLPTFHNSGDGSIVAASPWPATGAFSQELRKKSSRREVREGDIITAIEVTETWRRVREDDHSAPITQRVTVTKTTRQRASDGVLLEENEDEVIDDIDDGPSTTTADAVLSSSSSSSKTMTSTVSSSTTSAAQATDQTQEVVEEPFVKKEAFLVCEDTPPVVDTSDLTALEASIASDIIIKEAAAEPEPAEEIEEIEVETEPKVQSQEPEAAVQSEPESELVAQLEAEAESEQEGKTETEMDADYVDGAKSTCVESTTTTTTVRSSSSTVPWRLSRQESTESSTTTTTSAAAAETVPWRLAREETSLKIKRTSSQSPSRIAKRRPDAGGATTTKMEVEVAPGRRTTTTTTTSSSARNVGGVKQTSSSSSTSRVTMRSPLKDKAAPSAIPKLLNAAQSPRGNSTLSTSSPRNRVEQRVDSSELRTSPSPTRRPSNGASDLMDDSVDEFVRLEQQLEKESCSQVEEESAYARDILSRPSVLKLSKSASVERSPSPSSIKRQTLKSGNLASPTSPKRGADAKVSSPLRSQRPQSPLVTEQRRVATSSGESRTVKKSSPVSSTLSGLRTPTSSSSPRNSPRSSPAASLLKPGTLVRTIETTRTVTVRDHDDKPWRINSKKDVTKTTSSAGNVRALFDSAGASSGRRNLHGNVMNVVEKYVDTDGCAIHGHHNQSESTHSSRSRNERTTTSTSSSMSRSNRLDEKSRSEARTQDRSPIESEDREPEEQEEQVDDPEQPDEEEESTRSESPLPLPPIDLKALEEDSDRLEHYEVEPIPDAATGTDGVDDGLVSADTTDADAELVEPEPLENGRFREPLSVDRINRPSAEPSTSERIRTEEGVQEASTESKRSERPSLLFNRPASPSKEKMAVVSPVLGSPSVVLKALSRFDGPEKAAPADTEPTAEVSVSKSVSAVETSTTTTARASISKIRSAFESPTSTTSSLTSTLRRTTKEEKGNGRLRSLFEKPTPMSPAAPSVVPAAKPEPVVAPEVIPEPEPTTADEEPCVVQQQQMLTEPAEPVVAAEPAEPVQEDVVPATTTAPTIEEINDLTLLENMLNTATSYDDRCRIRAQLRIVRKKQGVTGSSPMTSRRTPSQTTSSHTSVSSESNSVSRRTYASTPSAKKAVEPQPSVDEPSPEAPQQANVQQTETVETTTTLVTDSPVVDVEQTDSSTSRVWSSSTRVVTRRSTSQLMTVTQTTESAVEDVVQTSSNDEQVVETVATEESADSTSVTEPSSSTAKDSDLKLLTDTSPVKNNPWKKMVERSESGSSLEEKSERTVRTLTTKKSQSELKIWSRLPEPDAALPEMAATLDITSSYGTGPTDEHGRPLFGLGALRRRPKQTSITDSTSNTPEPIIIERSQTLNELQKLHEQQQTQQKVETDQPTPAEKPRAKLRDTFTTPSKLGEEEEETDSSLEKEPIISERSQALKDIIRRHEHVTSEILMVNEPPPSPKPKAKLKDSFVLPEADEEVAEEVVPREPVVERSQSFQTIVKRHQELSQVTEQTSSPSQVTSAPASPIKRPGILKKPKDWSPSPSPQELASPARDASPSPKQTPAEDATASLASTVTNTTTATTTAIPRKNSIEIQLNPIDNHLVVVQQLPQAEIVGRRSSVITTYTTSTITTNKLTSQEETDEQVSSSSYPKEEPTPVPTRKTSIEIEPIRKSTSTWSSAVVEESQAIPEAEPTRTSSRFSSRVTTSKTSSSSTSEEPESWRVNSRLISSRTTEGVTKNDEEAPVTSRYTSRFSSRTDSTPSTVTSRFSKFTSRNPTEEPKTSSETANASRFSSSVSRRFTSRTSEVDSDASKTTAESTDAAPATVVPKEEDEVVSSRPSSSRLASRTSTVETTTTSRRFTTKSSDTDSEASKTVPEATDVAPTTVPPKEEEEVASPRPSSNRFASRTSTVETTTTSRRFTTKSSDTDSEASKTVPEATDAAPTTVPPKEEEEVASPRPSSNRFASRTSTVETTRTSRRFTTKSSDADAEASKTASEPMDAEPTETPKVEDDVVSPRPSSNRFSTKTSNVETTTTSRRFITRNSDADSDAPKTAETYRLEEIVSPRSASNRFVSKRSTLETTTSRDRFATSNSEVDSDVPVTSSGDADSTVTKTTTVSQMEVDAPTTTTRFSSSSRSSRFTSRTADSEPTQKATAAATEVQDEYVPIKITSRLSSSRFASANRQVDSSSVKSASSKQVEDESVAVSQRSTSAGHRSDSDVGSSTTQVTSMKLDVDNSQSAELKLTGDATGHTIHSTSTFQLVQPSSEGADDATPWRSKSTSREGSASPVRSRQSIQEVSAAIRAEVTQLTRQTSESGDALVREKSRKFSGEVAPARVSAESKTTGRLPASRYILQRQTSESLKLKPMAPRASVRALAQRFQSNSEEVTTQRKNSASSYPKAGLIFRSNSFRQKSCSPERETGRLSSSSVQRSESMRSGETTTRYRNRTSVDRQSEERDASCQSTAVVEPSSATESHTTVTTTSYQTTSRILPCDEPSTTEVTLELSPATASTTTTSTTTSSRSFLQDRTPIRGVQDILGRMKAGPETNGGHTTEDQHALSLLNKFLGAQILVQCTEPLVRSQSPGLAETVVTTSEQLSEDGKSLTRTRTANQEGSQHQVTSGSDDQGRAWTQQSSSSVSASHTVSTTQSLDDRSPSSMAEACIVDGVDINTCTDDFKLNELLDNCNEYETRCKLRARIKFLLNNTKGPAEGIKTSGRNFGSSVMTQNQVTRQTTTRSGPSAFAKFQQLDKSAKTSPSGSPVGSPQIKLFRSDSYGPKDMLLHWCKFRTKAYKSINIENFSTSWNDGMAFCALIHHFYPDAFDFDELSPSNKAYNFELAFKTADERAGIARLLDVEDMVAMQRPDWKCVFTYVQMFYRRFKDEV